MLAASLLFVVPQLADYCGRTPEISLWPKDKKIPVVFQAVSTRKSSVHSKRGHFLPILPLALASWPLQCQRSERAVSGQCPGIWHIGCRATPLPPTLQVWPAARGSFAFNPKGLPECFTKFAQIFVWLLVESKRETPAHNGWRFERLSQSEQR